MKITGWILVGILAFSLFTHFVYLASPSEVVFDEFYFGRFGSSYISETPYFDIHPPMGKLMLGFSAWVFNIEPTCSFGEIGLACDAYIFFALRFLPALFGVLTTLILYLLTKELLDKKIGLLVAFLFSLSNIFLLQARHIQIDIFLIFFGLLALYFFFKALNNKRQLLYFILSALSLGCCLSIKWTGVTFIGIIALLWFLKLLEKKIDFKKFILIAGIFALGVILVYLVQFYIHFQLIPGGGEVDDFLGENFQELSFPQKFTKINTLMLTANTSISSDHPYGSKFFQWPFMNEKILYWTTSDFKVQITSAGNPVIWILSTISMLLAFISLFYKKLRDEIYNNNYLLLVIIIGFMMGILPFVMINRVTYIYHYFPSYLFAMINLSVLFFYIKKHNQVVFWILIILAILGFIVISPQTYGFPPLVPYL